MKFRTEIGDIRHSFELSHDDRIVMLGSCFADNIGERLERDGFNVVHNPMGPLFNPASIYWVLWKRGMPFEDFDFVEHDGVWHCLFFASRYQGADLGELMARVNAEYKAFWHTVKEATAIILTFGTNKVFEYIPENYIVGNCHKLPGILFRERFLDVDEIIREAGGRSFADKTILTLSPVRYPGDGLPQGFLSKATLRVAIDRICARDGFDYFPSFEIMNDDLRDYRFYGADLRHPSDMGADYIYEKFSETYFSEATRIKALACRKISLSSKHRPIL